MANLYSTDVMKAVRRNIGLSDEHDTSKDDLIMKMPKSEVFERYCTWNGLMGGWNRSLTEAIESIYSVNLKD